MTTRPEHELDNVQKCLAAGFAQVVVLARDKKTLRAIEGVAEKTLTPSSRDQLRLLFVDDIVAYLDQADIGITNRDTTVRGYRVKVRYQSESAAAAGTRSDAIARVLARGMQRARRKA